MSFKEHPHGISFSGVMHRHPEKGLLNPTPYSVENKRPLVSRLHRDDVVHIAILTITAALAVASLVSLGGLSEKILPGQKSTLPANTDYRLIYEDNQQELLPPPTITIDRPGFLSQRPIVLIK